MTFGFVDFISVIILLLSGLIATYRGFVKESLGLFAWVVAAFAGLYGYKYISPLFDKIFTNQSVNNVISGFLVAGVILVVLTVINSYLNKSVRGSMLSGLDRTFGFMFGILRGGIIIVVLYIVGLFAAPVVTIEAEHNNMFPKYMKESLTYAKNILPKDISDYIIKLSTDAQNIYTKGLKEETKKYLEASYDETDRKTLNDLFDAVVASEQKDERNIKEEADTLEPTKLQNTSGQVTGSVSKDSDIRKNKQNKSKAKGKTQPPSDVKK